MIEITEKRSHNTRVFQDTQDPQKRVMEVGMALLHYHDGVEFKPLEDIKFPEGKQIDRAADLSMVDVPAWARAEVEEGGDVVRFYDKQDVAIHVFSDPFVVATGTKPFRVVDKFGAQIGNKIDSTDMDAKKASTNEAAGEKFELLEEDVTRVKFGVDNGKITFVFPEGMNPEGLQAYDDTDTSSTNNKDTRISQEFPTNNYGSNTITYVRGTNTSLGHRGIQHWTLPSDPGGTIDSIDVTVLTNFEQNDTLTVHELTQTGWVEAQATWNIYSTGNNWTTAGGDYSATVIESHAFTTAAPTTENIRIQGTGATNPLSLDWTDDVHLIFVGDNSASLLTGWDSKDHATSGNRPVLTITYTATSAAVDVSSHSTLPTSLVAYWELEEATATATWNDSKGVNHLTNNSTGSGVTSVAGIQGQGADFEAANTEYLDSADTADLSPTGDFTLAGWFKFESVPASAGDIYTIADKIVATGNQRSFTMYVNEVSSTMQAALAVSDDGVGVNTMTINYTFSTATWYHIGFVFDASVSTFELYVNGASIGTSVGTETGTFDGTAPFTLGYSPVALGGRPFAGIMDEIGFWHKEVSASEFTDLYNSGAGLPYLAASTFTPNVMMF